MKNLDTKSPTNNNKIEVFTALCDARAHLWSEFAYELHEAVDELQYWAVKTGLVGEIGQDEVQRIMAEAFQRRRFAP